MATYLYRCKACGLEMKRECSIELYELSPHVACLNVEEHEGDKTLAMKRVYTPLPFTMPMDGHMNPTVGRYVSGDREFRSALSQASDEASERTGITHNFQPIDLRDREKVGVSEEHLARDAKARHDAGKPPLQL